MYKLINQRSFRRITILGILMAVIIPSLIIIGKNAASYYTTRMQRLFTPEKVSCIVHDVFTEKLNCAITNYLSHTLTQESIAHADQKKIIAELKEEFSVIKDVEWKLLPSRTLQVTVHGTLPYCTLNKQLVVGNQKNLLSLDCFTQEQITQLPNITINQAHLKNKNYLPKRLNTFLHRIPADLWEGYTMSYHSPSRIEMKPKKSLCACTVITDMHSIFNTQKWDALNGIFNDLVAQQLITKKMLQAKQPILALDIRLQNRIIVKFFQSMVRGRGS